MANKYVKQITLGIDPIKGTRIRRRIYGTSKTDLERNIKAIIAEYGKHGLPSNLTFKQYYDKWLNAYASNLSPSTKAGYESVLNHAKPLHHVRMSNITRIDIQNILQTVWDRPATVSRLATLLHNMWDSATIDGVVDKNIVLKIKLPKKAKSERRALTEAELTAIRNTEFSDQEQLLVNILRQFGLRPGEALALTVKDFDRKAKTLTINKAVAYKKEEPYIKSTKTGVTRVLPVPDNFFNLLPTKGMYLFHHDGKLLTKKRKETLCRRICEKVNATMGGTKTIRATDMTCYYFRHTKATELYYTEGISTKQKAAYLGHSELEFLKTYSHLDEGKEAMEVLRKSVI